MVKNNAGKVCALLSYFLIGIIWYFADDKMRKNKLAGFHARQALILLIASIIIHVAGTIIPIIGWFFILPVGTILLIIWWLLGIYYAFTEQKKELFWIGQFAKKL